MRLNLWREHPREPPRKLRQELPQEIPLKLQFNLRDETYDAQKTQRIISRAISISAFDETDAAQYVISRAIEMLEYDTGAAQILISSYNFPRARKLDVGSPRSSLQGNSKLKRGLSGTIDGFKVSALADTGAAQKVVYSKYARARELDVESPRSSLQGNSKLKRGLSGTIDGFKVSALADTGAAQNVVSSDFARALELDVAGSPSSFRQGNSKLVQSLGTLNNRSGNLIRSSDVII